MSLWFMVDITIVFLGFINQRSHHWGAPSCNKKIHIVKCRPNSDVNPTNLQLGVRIYTLYFQLGEGVCVYIYNMCIYIYIYI